MGAHTPGPWEVVQGDEWTTDIGTPEGEYEDGRKRHWNVASVNRRRDEWEANRRLIAAAPDLLWALQSLLIANTANDEHAAVLLANDAIAKATGVKS
jgi:hypothetical protein